MWTKTNFAKRKAFIFVFQRDLKNNNDEHLQGNCMKETQ